MAKSSMQEIYESALADLRERIKYQGEWPDHNSLCDMLHEVSDGAVPVYTSGLCAIASDPDVFHHECELGQPKDTEQHVQYACYELVNQYLGGALDELRETMQDAGEIPAEDADEEGDES